MGRVRVATLQFVFHVTYSIIMHRYTVQHGVQLHETLSDPLLARRIALPRRLHTERGEEVLLALAS